MSVESVIQFKAKFILHRPRLNIVIFFGVTQAIRCRENCIHKMPNMFSTVDTTSFAQENNSTIKFPGSLIGGGSLISRLSMNIQGRSYFSYRLDIMLPAKACMGAISALESCCSF